MTTPYCLFGNTTCPFEHPEQKGGAVVSAPRSWVQIHCHVNASVLPTSPTGNKTILLPLLHWIPHLIPSTVKAPTSGQQIKAAAFKQFVRDTPTRDRKGQLCKLLPVPLFKSPSDRRTHLGMGASNHFKESPLFAWLLWGHGPRQVIGSHFYAGSLINLPLISYRGFDSGFAPYPLDLLCADFSLKSAVDLWVERP